MWRRFYAASDLLNAPVESVRFTPDEHLEITFFADPFSFDSLDTQKKIVDIAHYLDQHRVDRVPA